MNDSPISFPEMQLIRLKPVHIGLKDSIHSKDKLRIKYPGVNVSAIQTLYGLNVSPMAQDRWIFAYLYKLIGESSKVIRRK